MAREQQAQDETPDLQTQVNAMMAELTMLRSAVKQSANANGLDGNQLEQMFVRVAKISADAQERAANPSNKNFPYISVFSYPEGDRIKERKLICPMVWAGEDVTPDTTTAEEIELLNQVQPGTFAFTRTDGRTETLFVTADRGPAQEIQKLRFSFSKENRDTLPSMVGMLRAALKLKTPEQIELDALRAQLATMQGKSLVTA